VLVLVTNTLRPIFNNVYFTFIFMAARDLTGAFAICAGVWHNFTVSASKILSNSVLLNMQLMC
jgi:hypothetical protein